VKDGGSRVAVIGAGIVGAAVAERLARAGHDVTLVERGAVGGEASWTAGGLLTPVHPWNYPQCLLELDMESFGMWPDLARRLREETGVDLELRRTGMLTLVETDEDEGEADRRAAWRSEQGEPTERLTAAAALAEEPALNPEIRGALFTPGLSQVRNHRAAPALALAAERRGSRVLEHTSVLGLTQRNGRVRGVRTSSGPVDADHVVLCAGAWSGVLLPGGNDPTTPARGQILLLRTAPGALRHMVLAGGNYLVPRADGRILAGSTVEYVGFDTNVTLDGLRSIADAVHRMTPGLGSARVEDSWAGLRPDTPDHLPLLGRAQPGLVVATGHFRSGIMLAPVTAEIVLELVEERCERDLAPFDPNRFAA
jgi:glycine oxidase